MEDQLKEQQKAVEIEKRQKAQLENLLSKMQQKLVVGGKALEEKEKIRAKELREMQLKIDEQQHKEKVLFEETKKKEEEMLMAERKYEDLQEEVDDNRKIIKELRARYKAALQEIDDIRKENQDGNEENLVTIREQANEIDFYQKLVKNLLKPNEVSMIKAKSKNTDNGWKIAPFILKKHEVNFPKLSRGQAKVLVEEDLNQRDISFQNSPSVSQINNSSLKKNTSKKIMNSENNELFSPKGGKFKVQQDKGYSSMFKDTKTSRHGGRHKKNISVNPPKVSINNSYMNNSFEVDDNQIPNRNIKKPNPTLAPISQKIRNVPDLSNNGVNLEAMIPSVDELRKRRGDLLPLNHNIAVKRNNSYDSQDY